LEHQRSNPQHFAPCHINEQQQQQGAEMATATALEDNGEEEDALNDNNKKQPNLLCPPTENAIGTGTLTLRKSASWCSNDAAVQLIQSNGASRGQTQTSSSGNGSSGGGRSLESTNRMLAAICSVFLLIEVIQREAGIYRIYIWFNIMSLLVTASPHCNFTKGNLLKK
jgi:hypothetical protein